MDMTVAPMGLDFTSDKLGKHFIANIEAHKLLAHFYVRNAAAPHIVSDHFFGDGNIRGDYRMNIVQIIQKTCYETIRIDSIHSKIQSHLPFRFTCAIAIDRENQNSPCSLIPGCHVGNAKS